MQLQLMLQQQYAQEIPEVVKNFIIYFHRNILENNVYELHGIYENSFNRLTEKFYAKTPWPEADYIAPLVNDGNCCYNSSFDLFLLLMIGLLKLYRSSVFDFIS